MWSPSFLQLLTLLPLLTLSLAAPININRAAYNAGGEVNGEKMERRLLGGGELPVDLGSIGLIPVSEGQGREGGPLADALQGGAGGLLHSILPGEGLPIIDGLCHECESKNEPTEQHEGDGPGGLLEELPLGPLSNLLHPVTDLIEPVTDLLHPELLPVLHPVSHLLEPVTDIIHPVTTLLDPVTDLIGDALDLVLPTTLICANLGADVLDVIDVKVCACLELDKGGLFFGSDAIVGLGGGLRTKVESAIRLTGLQHDYPAHGIPDCDGRGGFTCPPRYQRSDGTCGPSILPPSLSPSPSPSLSVSPPVSPEASPSPSPTISPNNEIVVSTPSSSISSSTSAATTSATATPEPSEEDDDTFRGGSKLLIQLHTPSSSSSSTSSSTITESAQPTPTPTPAPAPILQTKVGETNSGTGNKGDGGDGGKDGASGPDGGNSDNVESGNANEDGGPVGVFSADSNEIDTETLRVIETRIEVVETVTIPATAYIEIITSTATVTETSTAPPSTITQTEITTDIITSTITETTTDTDVQVATTTITLHDCANSSVPAPPSPSPSPSASPSPSGEIVIAQAPPSTISATATASPTASQSPEVVIQNGVPSSSPSPSPTVFPSAEASPTASPTPSPARLPPVPACPAGEEFKETMCCRLDMYEVDGQCECAPGKQNDLDLRICADLCFGELLDGLCINANLGVDSRLPIRLGLGSIGL